MDHLRRNRLLKDMGRETGVEGSSRRVGIAERDGGRRDEAATSKVPPRNCTSQGNGRAEGSTAKGRQQDIGMGEQGKKMVAGEAGI